MPNDMTLTAAAAVPALPAPAPEPRAATLEHADALAAVQHLNRIRPRRTPIPALSGVLLEHDGDALRLIASDLDIWGEALFPGSGGARWAAVVPLESLAKVLQRTKGKAPGVALEPVDVSAGVAWRVAVVAGRTRVTLDAVAAPRDFPAAPSGPFPVEVTAPRADVAAVFTRPAFAMSEEETRHYLRGLYLHAPDAVARAESPDPDGRFPLRAVATDGHRLARLDSALRVSGDPDALAAGHIMPAGAVRVAGKILAGKAGPDLARLEFGPDVSRVTCGALTLTAKAVAGTFPDYTRVMPAGDAHLSVDRAELADAVQAVQIVSDSRSRRVGLDITATGGVASCSGESGRAEQAFAAEVVGDGEETATGFNAAYLADVTGAFRESDRLEVTQTGPGDPARFDAADDGLSVVVMPMRRN